MAKPIKLGSWNSSVRLLLRTMLVKMASSLTGPAGNSCGVPFYYFKKVGFALEDNIENKNGGAYTDMHTKYN